MTSTVLRRVTAALVLALLCVAYWTFDVALKIGLRHAEIASGISLLALVIFLAIFNARKKLPFLPLLKVSTWLRFHVYAGWLSLAFFFIHSGFRVPTGGLETLLASVFLAVAFSGVVGLVISRWIPPRLTLQGENIIFERIPALRRSVQKEVEDLVISSVGATSSSTIVDFYESKLRSYFERPRALLPRLIGHIRVLHGVLAQIEAMDRYLNDEERKIMTQIAELARVKDNLDFQLAAQGLLKLWLFVHIPLTGVLIIVAVVHGFLAFSFS